MLKYVRHRLPEILQRVYGGFVYLKNKISWLDADTICSAVGFNPGDTNALRLIRSLIIWDSESLFFDCNTQEIQCKFVCLEKPSGRHASS